MKRLLFWLIVGALIAWFADPVSGADRRRAVNDLARRTSPGAPSPGAGI